MEAFLLVAKILCEKTEILCLGFFALLKNLILPIKEMLYNSIEGTTNRLKAGDENEKRTG
ncbi:hypothetical protein G15_1964 [Enterococcus avium]|nr:hypothetical protein G15_1964 [Enterococcus avium]HCM87973.1 hypothetical protein [Enterococcus sp.]